MTPCDITNWRPGRWRPVRAIKTTVDNPHGPIADDEIRACRGGGVPIGAKIVVYEDKPRRWGESWYDFEWEVETRN